MSDESVGSGRRRPIIAVIGGGQLVRMMTTAATRLDIELRVLVESADAPVAQVLPGCVVGRPADEAAVRRLVDGADVLTFEHEHVPPALLHALEAEGHAVRPSPHALLNAQDKLAMRRRLLEVGLPTPRWAEVLELTDVAAFSETVGWPLVVKTPRGGYDGHGVLVARSVDEVAPWLDRHGVLLAEELVDFTRELAVLSARRPSGEIRTWPVIETVQVDGICFQATAPVLGIDNRVRDEAVEVARAVAETLDVTGVLAVEMFQLREQRLDGARVVINELAMRPHNSGHWTIDGSVTSQFEQHLRAVLDLPLGDTIPRSPWNVMVNVLGGPGPVADLSGVLTDPGVRVELYGKEPRPGRKLGHVVVSGADIADVTRRALAAAQTLSGQGEATVDTSPAAPMYAPPPGPRLRADGSAIPPDHVVRPVDDLGDHEHHEPAGHHAPTTDDLTEERR